MQVTVQVQSIRPTEAPEEASSTPEADAPSADSLPAPTMDGGGLLDAMSLVHALMSKSQQTDKKDGVEDAEHRAAERADALERAKKAEAEAAKKAKESSIWGTVLDVVSIAAVAASAVATVATFGASAPALVGIALLVFVQVENHTQFMEKAGVSADVTKGCVIGANIVSVACTAGAGAGSLVGSASSTVNAVGFGLKTASDVESKFHLLALIPVKGSDLISASFTVGAGVAGGAMSGAAEAPKDRELAAVASYVKSGSQVGSGVASAKRAAVVDEETHAHLDAASANSEAKQASKQEQAVIDALGQVMGEWQHALDVLGKCLSGVQTSQLDAARMRA